MPLFEYACAACGTRFELLVREGTVPACPSCHSARVEKQLSAFAVGAGTTRPAPGAPGPACGGCPHAGQPGGCSFADN